MGIKDYDDNIFSSLEKRCIELMKVPPPKINRYLKTIIEKQKEENYVLKNKVVSSIMVIKKLLNHD